MACTENAFSTLIDAKGDITCKRADTFHLEVEFTHEDDSTAHDLTQYDELTANVKVAAKDTTYVLQFKLTTGFSVSSNVLTWDKTATEMKIEAKSYSYDIEATKGTTVTTIGGGAFVIMEDVTRDGDTL